MFREMNALEETECVEVKDWTKYPLPRRRLSPGPFLHLQDIHSSFVMSKAHPDVGRGIPNFHGGVKV
jgi:hypothetical protein